MGETPAANKHAELRVDRGGGWPQTSINFAGGTIPNAPLRVALNQKGEPRGGSLLRLEQVITNCYEPKKVPALPTITHGGSPFCLRAPQRSFVRQGRKTTDMVATPAKNFHRIRPAGKPGPFGAMMFGGGCLTRRIGPQCESFVGTGFRRSGIAGGTGPTRHKVSFRNTAGFSGGKETSEAERLVKC